MKIKSEEVKTYKEGEIQFKYFTDVFTVSGKLGRRYYGEQDHIWIEYEEEVREPAQIEAELSFTERASINEERFRIWYVVHVEHYDNLNRDGTYKPSKYQTVMHIGSHPLGPKESTLDYQVNSAFESRFPDHNVKGSIKVNSSILSLEDLRGNEFDELIKPYVMDFVDKLPK